MLFSLRRSSLIIIWTINVKITFACHSEVRECLKLDPDHKDCFPHYKKVKKLNKQMSMAQSFINDEKWDECVEKADQMLVTEPRIFSYVLRARGHRCHCYAKVCAQKQARKG